MPRPKDPNKKPRQFSDIFAKYKTYDTSQGFGTLEDIKSSYESMTGEQAQVILQDNNPLTYFGFTSLPTIEDLKSAYRRVMMEHQEAFTDTTLKSDDPKVVRARQVIAAYKVLQERIAKKR